MSQLDDLVSAVQDLRARLDRIEQQIMVNDSEVRISCGDTSIRLTRIDVQINTDRFVLRTAGDAQVKSGGTLALQANKILVDRIESGDELTISCGESSIRLKKNGDTSVRASVVDVAAVRHAQIKAAGDLVLKGSRIIEN